MRPFLQLSKRHLNGEEQAGGGVARGQAVEEDRGKESIGTDSQICGRRGIAQVVRVGRGGQQGRTNGGIVFVFRIVD